ncbi:sentrin-specific protease 8 [Drosophila innubila]|uniref:sentrin-specific protease 8 n=1 Tax=Drosophila innubila TaxID=198719 RepID=UPI00148E1E36|nr:sentrin-specific protease 8 [Drosophila innubila]
MDTLKVDMSKTKKIAKKSDVQQRLVGAKVGPSCRDYGSGRPEAGDASRSTVSLRFHELSLRHSDVQLLQGPHALNERLLSFYYTYLQSRRYKMKPELHFLSPASSQSLRHLELRERRRLVRDLQLASKQFVFVPLSEESHWSLLLVARPDRRFYYFDSEDNRHLIVAQLLYETLRGVLAADEYHFTVGRCLQLAKGQGHESGVHLMCMTDTLADYVSRCGYATSTLLISIQEVRGMRASQLQLIRTLGGIFPPSSGVVKSLSP